MKLHLTCLLVLILASGIHAEILDVPEDFETIQAAIDASEDGDTVLVQPGTYVENINFLGKSITVASLILTTGNGAYIDSTLIDGDANGRSVVVFQNDENEDAVLVGFTICNGTSDYGGGIYCNGAGPQFCNLLITNNEAEHNGGGIYCTRQSFPTVMNLVVSNNSAGRSGGGISCYNSSNLLLSNSIITGNTAQQNGGGIQCSAESQSTLTDVEILNNEARYYGGGLFCYEAESFTMNSSLVSGNRSRGDGGGIGFWFTEVMIRNSLICCNIAISNGGAMFIAQSNVVLFQVTTAENEAEYAGGICCHPGIILSVLNSILWDVGSEIAYTERSNPREVEIRFSDVSGGEGNIILGNDDMLRWGDGNLNLNPHFANPDESDYHLTADSPCIDAADPEADLDPDGTRADMGAFYFHQRDIEVEPEALEFIDIQTGTIDSLSFTIRNTGGTPLTITSLNISPDNTPFRVEWDGNEFEVEADSFFTGLVTFSPEHEAEYEATLRIESDDPDEEVVELPVSGTALSVNDDETSIPVEFSIVGIYPNPFNSTTTISFSISTTEKITLSLNDIYGHNILILINRRMRAGRYEFLLRGDDLPSGVYLFRLMNEREVRIGKVVLVR